MDHLDKQILEHLRRDARCPYVKIAKDEGVTEGAIRYRVKKLLSEGVISGFKAEVRGEYQAIAAIEIDQKIPRKEITSNISGLAKTYEVGGSYDLICLVTSHEVLERIKNIKGVMHTDVFPILKDSS